jgi:hypothetical protein
MGMLYRLVRQELLSWYHKVYRVQSLFSSRPNWDPPHPLVSVSPFCSGGGGYTCFREREWGVPIWTRGQTLWCSRYKCTFWVYSFSARQALLPKKFLAEFLKTYTRSFLLSFCKLKYYRNPHRKIENYPVWL